MHQLVSQSIRGQTICLSAERCVFWENTKTLILADLHLGKSGHFRKEGIGIPQAIYKEDLQRLIQQISFFKAERLIIAGDFTHHYENAEMDLFLKWRKDFSLLQIDLVRGNHDKLAPAWYQHASVRVHDSILREGSFAFCHDVEECNQTGETDPLFTFSGHVHPGIRLRGKGRQLLRVPCFYFSSHYCVLPAFSHFTGTRLIHPCRTDTVVAIVNHALVRLN